MCRLSLMNVMKKKCTNTKEAQHKRKHIFFLNFYTPLRLIRLHLTNIPYRNISKTSVPLMAAKILKWGRRRYEWNISWTITVAATLWIHLWLYHTNNHLLQFYFSFIFNISLISRLQFTRDFKTVRLVKLLSGKRAKARSTKRVKTNFFLSLSNFSFNNNSLIAFFLRPICNLAKDAPQWVLN